MFLNWENIYSVNVKEIDDQHKKLFSLINEVHSLEEKNNLEIKKIIKEMIEYSVYHFDTEEKYFEKYGYPFEEEHEKMHEMYKDAIKKIEENFDNQSTKENILNISNFLKNWWLNHIQKEDIKYSTFFNKKGLY